VSQSQLPYCATYGPRLLAGPPGEGLTRAQAGLIAAARIADVPSEVLGARVGLCAHSLRRRQRAERALARAVTLADGRAPAAPGRAAVPGRRALPATTAGDADASRTG
jgi:hypothetical protein